ncbi:MAG: phospholipid carrier-dependent glycosyltransferase [Candidatus Yanofskybacteria bacterium]|nr:phospholipid carrier-dependent glycosyltransferase [Candidatus Yanofskybacteria bacterium]
MTQKKKFALIVLGVSLLTHFLFFGHPNQTVFDEVHFGKFISGYYTHEYFFDIHPPLGKLILAGFGKVFDFQPEFSFANIGDQFPDGKYKVLRFLPSLAGALLAVVGFALVLELGLSVWAGLALGILLSLENALLVQSRFILLDSFLLLFGFLSLFHYLRYRNGSTSLTTGGKGRKELIFMAIFGALAVSVKWTGATFLALAGLSELIVMIRNRKFPDLGYKIGAFVGIPLAIYFLVFAVHFSLLTKSGTGDAFMSQEFQKTLQGSVYENNPNLRAPNMVGKFIELNEEMYSSNQRLDATHPYSSRWYTWPLMARSIFYWVSDQERIYLLGNPVIWWLSTAAILTLIVGLITKRYHWEYAAWFLLAGYILNLMPFIGIQRVMFLYHYLIGLIFAMVALVYLIDREKNKKQLFVGLIALALGTFVYFAPLTYGLGLSSKAYEQRVWINSWR